MDLVADYLALEGAERLILSVFGGQELRSIDGRIVGAAGIEKELGRLRSYKTDVLLFRERTRAIEIVEGDNIRVKGDPFSGSCGDYPFRVGTVEQYSALVEKHNELLAQAFVRLVEGAEERPWTALYLLTEGIEREPGLELRERLLLSCKRRGGRGDVAQYLDAAWLVRMVKAARASGVSIFPVDLGGLRLYDDASLDLQSLLIRNLQVSQIDLARNTGGKAVLNSNRPWQDLQPILETAAPNYRVFVSSGLAEGERFEVRLREPQGRELVVVRRP
ncbi:MAG: hypothetical protein AAF690_12200 [Acidobacteriota bacterium]